MNTAQKLAQHPMTQLAVGASIHSISKACTVTRMGEHLYNFKFDEDLTPSEVREMRRFIKSIGGKMTVKREAKNDNTETLQALKAQGIARTSAKGEQA